MLCALPFAFALGLCPDETISGHSDPGIVWRLSEVDGVPFPGTATIAFPEEGIVVGVASCNAYRATQLVPFPWIEIRDIVATRKTCPDRATELRFFKDLAEMSLVEASLDVLLLTSSAGREMVFVADED